MQKPTFIGIGAPKSGTNYLYQALDQHPQVVMSNVLEPHYFSGFNKGFTWEDYQQCFSERDDAQAYGEFSVNYMATPRIAHDMIEALPNVRIIASVRHPADLIYSYYWQLRRMNRLQHPDRAGVNLTFEESLEQQRGLLCQPAYLGKYLEQWIDVFGKEHVLIAFLDDIKQKPDQVLGDLYRFVGVDPSFRPGESKGKVHGGVSPKSKLADRAYIHTYNFLNRCVWVPAQRTLGYRRAAAIKDKLRVRDRLASVFFKPGYDKIEPALRASLTEDFESEITKLEELTGRDLQHWRNA